MNTIFENLDPNAFTEEHEKTQLALPFPLVWKRLFF